MILNYNDYLNFEFPNDWCVEDDGEELCIYNSDGEGAMTISFFNLLGEQNVIEQISIVAKKFFDQNGIVSDGPFVVHTSKDNETKLCGTGMTADNWFMKLWIVSKGHKLVLASYQSEKKTKEVKICDGIIDKIEFAF